MSTSTRTSLAAIIALLALVLARDGALAAGDARPAARGEGDALRPAKTPLRASLEEDFGADGATLTFTLTVPQLSGCGHLVTSVEQSASAISITVEGTRRDIMCTTMDPPPPSAAMKLLPGEGRRTLTVRAGGRADELTLDLGADTVSIRPSRPLVVTTLDREGVMLRVPKHAFWIDVSYSSEAARAANRPHLGELVAALESRGARRISPRKGIYAARYLAWAALDPRPRDPSSFTDDGVNPGDDHVYLTHDGPLDQVSKVAEGWKRYDARHDCPGSEFMSIHIGDWRGGHFNSDSDVEGKPCPRTKVRHKPAPAAR
jgi:hypothetical protein